MYSQIKRVYYKLYMQYLYYGFTAKRLNNRTGSICIWSIYISVDTCGSYHDFLDIELLLTRQLMNEGFILVKLKS